MSAVKLLKLTVMSLVASRMGKVSVCVCVLLIVCVCLLVRLFVFLFACLFSCYLFACFVLIV